MNILFVLAHPDDESYGPAGTIANLSINHTVLVKILCNGARPGAEHVAVNRQLALSRACAMLGADVVHGGVPDLGLNYRYAAQEIERTIAYFAPTAVYTNNISDINADHRVVAEACLIACRPKPTCGVRELYFSEIVSSTSWSFNQLQPAFIPNMYVDITDTIDLKRQALELYETETYVYPDARSVEATLALAKYRGSQVGMEYAEAFNQVFRLE